MDLGARLSVRPGALPGPGRAGTPGALARLAIRLVLALGCATAAQAQVTISQQPLLAATPPPPNVVMTIDDSGSMSYAYAPDLVGYYNSSPAFTSFSYNPLYYNPQTTYVVPPNAAGNPVSSPTFNKAYYDGFNPDQGYVDLSCAYTPTLNYTPGSTGATQTCPLAAGTVPPTNGSAGGPQSATGVYGPAYYYNYTGGTGCPVPVTPGNPPPSLDPNVPPPSPSCFTQVIVGTQSGPNGTDETLNFAIWYSFYRTRHQSIVSAAAQAMQDKGLQASRVAWQALNSCGDNFTATNCAGWRGTSFDDRISTFAGQHKTDFYNWLAQLPAAGFTPTRVAWWRAGQYYTTKGPNSPYGADPNDPNGTAGANTADLQCVNNFNITLTDGLWNKNNENGQTNFCGSGACGGLDTQSITFPDGTNYPFGVSTTIYGGGDGGLATGGLADIAFYYWATNLRPDLTGFNTPPYYPQPGTTNPITGATNDATWPYWNSLNDPATWPHMVNFTIGVGLGGFLSLPGLVWSGDAHDPTPNSAYRNLLAAAPACGNGNPPSDPCTWPPVDPNASGNGFTGAVAGNGNVYDLWHAAINSRGNAFSASSSQDIVNDMAAIVARIEGQSHGNSTAAGSSPSLSASTQLYVASYVGTDWHGVVTAFGVDSTGAVLTTPTWQTTAASIPPAASRTVFTASAVLPSDGTGLGTARPGISLAYVSSVGSGSSGLPADLLNDIGDSQTSQNQVSNYLLGDASYEQRNGGLFRDRNATVLGDIIDSNPVYTWTESFGYQILPEGQTGNGYSVFLGTKSSRLPMVYAGANDGMLHGFNANNGNEVFAYIPHSVFNYIASEKFQGAATPTLQGLVNPNYNTSHFFSVDGPVFVGDAYFGDTSNAGASWRSVLIGTTGAGGPGVFALDVSNPQSITKGDVLWDIDGVASGDPNLGYTIGQPIIARLNDGNWAAVFGNGYSSPRGCAVLYIVYLYNGQVRTIDTSGASPGTTTACSGANASNGLGSPTLLDLDQNGTIDYVFAGDLHGNLWKFDLTATTPGNWSVAYGPGSSPTPLFVATTAGGKQQPIVAAPNLGPAPNNPAAYILYFVTGHMFAVGDPTDTTTQSLYAVQDSGVPVTGSRASLIAQTLIPATDGSANENIKQPPATVNIPPSNGWYIDFPNLGERALSEPLLVDGIVLTSTVIRNTQPCNGDCGGFIYAVNQFTGAGGLNFLLDTSDNTFYDGLATSVGCVRGITLITKGETLEWYAAGNGPPNASSSGTNPPGSGPGNTGVNTGAQGGADSTQIQHGAGSLKVPGRISWHEVIQQ